MLDTDTRELRRKALPIHLSPKAFQLLQLLVENRPKALSKASLQERLWPDTFVVEANLSNLVGEVRAALGDDAHRPHFVRTVHAFGYAFRDTSPVDGLATSPSAVFCRLVWKGGRATSGTASMCWAGILPSHSLLTRPPSLGDTRAC